MASEQPIDQTISAIEAVREALGAWVDPQYGDLSTINAERAAGIAVQALAALGWGPPPAKWHRCSCNHRDRRCWYQCQNGADGTHQWPTGEAICGPCARRCDPENQPGKAVLRG